MSIKGIFGLFGTPEDDDRFKKEIEDSLDVFKDTPHFKVGMFCKMIKNGSNFTNQLLNFFKTSKDSIDMSGVDEASEIMMYNRAMSWIQECNLEDDNWIQNIDSNRKYNDNFINKSPTEFLYNKNNIFIQNDKKSRKRDVYSHNIGESPKPSDFVELYEIFIKKNKTN